MIQPLADALAERGFDTLTPVQQAVIAPELTQEDLLVSAQTGSGKTVGFGLAIAPTLLAGAERFGPAAAPLGLVIAPTRELASQVMRELAWLYARTDAVVTSCVGGMDMRQERRALERGAHLVVGTPGRLRDHIERGALDLGALRAVVLDEADEMLDMGFREDLEFMLAEAPAGRRTLLFSATVPPVIARLAQEYQRDARRISTLGGATQHADIVYQAVRVAASDVDNAIFNLLRYHHDQGALVFANTRATVAHLTARLANRGLSVVSLSGELSQSERTHALQAMRDGRARVCVATDVAARGIDLPRLNLVIHADLPGNTESLLHRSGRTGRAGRKGISALIVPPKGLRRAENLLKWAKIAAEWVVAPSVEDILRRDEERLLTDPAWDDPPGEEALAFAARLLAQRSPEEVAAGYLRLYHARHAAPEDLLPPDTRAAPREKARFGPSAWVALSVGHAQRAEARWLLPMLCRAGGLDRAAIGAIRVQESETFVEIAQGAVDGFLARLGPGGTMEEGVTVRPLDAVPDLAAPSGHPPREVIRPSAGRKQARPERKGRAAGEGVSAGKAAARGSAMVPEASEATAKTSEAAEKPRGQLASMQSEPFKVAAPAVAVPKRREAPVTAKRPEEQDVSRNEGRTRAEAAQARPGRQKIRKAPATQPAGAAASARHGEGRSAGERGATSTKPGDKYAGAARHDQSAAGGPGRLRRVDAPLAAAPKADPRDTSKRFMPPGKGRSQNEKPSTASAGSAGRKAGGSTGGKSGLPASGKPGGKPGGKGAVMDKPTRDAKGRRGAPAPARQKPSGRPPRPGRPGGDQPPRRGKP